MRHVSDRRVTLRSASIQKSEDPNELGKLDGSVCVRGDDGIDQRGGYRARGCERCVRRDATRIAKPGGESNNID